MHADIADELNGTARDRRSHSLWRAARDPAVSIPLRWFAQVVSVYDRAPIRDILTPGVFALVEGATTGIMVRVALRVTGASLPRSGEDAAPDSGWPGTLLALAIWLLPFAAMAASVLMLR